MARVSDMILGSVLLGSGGNSGMTIELLLNTSTYVLTANLKDKKGTVVSTSSIDLPLESTVVTGSYDNTNKQLVLTLVSGETVDIPIGDLINGLQSTIQYDTIPTASAGYAGKIVQYTGETDSTYTNGYFYLCTSTTENGVTTYSWENINVQVGEKNGGFYTFDYDEYGTYRSGVTFEKLKAMYDDIRNGRSIMCIRYALTPTITGGNSGVQAHTLVDITGIGTTQIKLRHRYMGFWGLTGNSAFKITTGEYGNAELFITLNITNGELVSGVIDRYTNHVPHVYLSTINTIAYTPTSDYHPATKKYVDDSATTYSEKMVETVAPVYSSSSAYAIGDYVSYQGKLYVCSTAISTAEEFDSTHWTETTAMSVVGNINTILSSLTTVGGNS